MEEIKRKRKCKYAVQVLLPEDQRESPADTGYFLKEGQGWFHRWADDVEADDGFTLGQITVAIVEDCDSGKCYNVHPTEIQFIE